MTHIDNNKDELDAKKLEVKATFDNCTDGENKLQQIIDTATEDYDALVKKLDIREEQKIALFCITWPTYVIPKADLICYKTVRKILIRFQGVTK